MLATHADERGIGLGVSVDVLKNDTFIAMLANGTKNALSVGALRVVIQLETLCHDRFLSCRYVKL